jgi:peptidoglycan hydrolase-like protein with peptidoglycan-binding domain
VLAIQQFKLLVEKGLNMIPELVKHFQNALHRLGFLADDHVYGELDHRTRQAIKRFQEQFGLEVSGELDGEPYQRIAQAAAESKTFQLRGWVRHAADLLVEIHQGDYDLASSVV